MQLQVRTGGREEAPAAAHRTERGGILNLLGIKVLLRARVDRQLDQLFSYPLTVVRAPMGFGKTTVLRAYVQTKHLEAIWLSLLGSGGSLAYCWERLTAQISKKNKALGVQLENLGFPGDAAQRAKMVELICGRSYPEPTLVVVDDYQLIDCPQVADLITTLAGEETQNLHIVLLARDTPVLPVADLERRGLCLLLGRAMLQFNTEEIGAYFSLMNCPATEEVLGSVSRWTGGWISGIYLLLRGMRQGLPMGRGADIDQLLELNLYRAYDKSTQIFLQKLSFLDAFTPEQVAYVFENSTYSAKLLSLVQGNAFLVYNTTLLAYKMTDLLQEFLQEKAHQSGINPAPLWRRMGQWFLDRGKSVLAYDYLYRAGDLETILQDLDKADARDIGFTQFPQIHKIFEGLPMETAYRYPLATLRHIRVKALTEPPSARHALEERLEDMRQFFTTANCPEERRTRILGEIHNTWVFAAFNNLHEAVRHAQLAVQFFAGRYSCIVSNQTEFTFGAPHLLYCYYNEAGKLRERAEFISTNFHVLGQAVEGCGFGSEPLALAEYALETGDFGAVECSAQTALYQARQQHQSSIEICATFVLARLKLFRGNFEEGAELISRLSVVIAGENNSVLNTTMELCSAYVNSCFGKLSLIPRWLRENDLGTGNFMFQGIAFPYIVCMRALLLAGDFVGLEVLCQQSREKFALYNNQLGFIHNYICAAVAKEHLYGTDEGCAELAQALMLAAADGVVMPFAENAAGVLPLLRKLRGAPHIAQPFLKRVIACCEEYHRGVYSLLPDSVTLTDREKEILQMLAQGMKHEEIGGKLYISVPTVRYHVKNIYHKLEVNNKVSAIQKAKAMNMI